MAIGLICLLLSVLASCGGSSESAKKAPTPSQQSTATAPSIPQATIADTASAPKTHVHEGKVVKALQALGPNTTYLELESNNKRFWIAASKLDTKVGDTVQYSTDNAVKMRDFTSTALGGRKFDEILFIPDAKVKK